MRLHVFIKYKPLSWNLEVGVKQGENIRISTNEVMNWQAHITLLPLKNHKFKTAYKTTSTPIFNQTFFVKNIARQVLQQLAVRFRVYGRPGCTGRKMLLGETVVDLSHVMQMKDHVISDWRVLRTRDWDNKTETMV